MVLRIWDVFMLEGMKVVFRVGLQVCSHYRRPQVCLEMLGQANGLACRTRLVSALFLARVAVRSYAKGILCRTSFLKG